MREYTKLYSNFVIGEMGKRILKSGLLEFSLAVNLVVAPESNFIGLYHIPLVTLSHRLNVDINSIKLALDNLRNCGFCKYDTSSETVFIRLHAQEQLGEYLAPRHWLIRSVKTELRKNKESPFCIDFINLYSSKYNLGTFQEFPFKQQTIETIGSENIPNYVPIEIETEIEIEIETIEENSLQNSLCILSELGISETSELKTPNPRSELDWRTNQVWSSFLLARDSFHGTLRGPKPAMTPKIKKAISEAIKVHDSAYLSSKDRDEWLENSLALAAGKGLFLDRWMTGDNPEKKKFLEAWRPWTLRRDGSDPVERFSRLYFDHLSKADESKPAARVTMAEYYASLEDGEMHNFNGKKWDKASKTWMEEESWIEAHSNSTVGEHQEAIEGKV